MSNQAPAIAGALLKMLPLIVVMVLLAPLQWLANALSSRWLSQQLPLVFHRVALWCMGVRVKLAGQPLKPGPVLLVGNHISWLDIVMLAAQAPIRFVSKDVVATWPVFGTLARLQNTLFVSRTRRSQTGRTAEDMRDALACADRLVLFAEGTSTDGSAVLPFRSALLGALVGDAKTVQVQPFTIAYLRRDGLPLNAAQRATLGWYGDIDLLPSLLEVIHGGPLDVTLWLGAPQSLEQLGGRKLAAQALEYEVRQTLAAALRGRE